VRKVDEQNCGAPNWSHPIDLFPFPFAFIPSVGTQKIDLLKSPKGTFHIPSTVLGQILELPVPSGIGLKLSNVVLMNLCLLSFIMRIN
jgi:hypothetical protein